MFTEAPYAFVASNRFACEKGGELVRASDLQPASLDDKSDWSCLADAVARVKAGEADHVCFVLARDFPCIVGTLPAADAEWAVANLKSYTQRSVDGHGVQAFLCCDAVGDGDFVRGPGGHVCWANAYVVLTDDLVPGSSRQVEEDQGAVDRLMDRVRGREAAAPPKEAAAPPADVARRLLDDLACELEKSGEVPTDVDAGAFQAGKRLKRVRGITPDDVVEEVHEYAARVGLPGDDFWAQLDAVWPLINRADDETPLEAAHKKSLERDWPGLPTMPRDHTLVASTAGHLQEVVGDKNILLPVGPLAKLLGRDPNSESDVRYVGNILRGLERRGLIAPKGKHCLEAKRAKPWRFLDPTKPADARRFKSQYGGGMVTSAHRLAEIACERFARRQEPPVSLPDLFWGLKEWRKEFGRQMAAAERLQADGFDHDAVTDALYSQAGKHVYSLSAAKLLPLVERARRTIAGRTTVH